MQTPQKLKSQKPSNITKIHSEQLSKLKQKHHHEYDLLEDIRSFSKQRSIIEKEYAQALTKLAHGYLQKSKFPPPPDIKENPEFRKGRTISQVWKTVLEVTEAVGKTRQQAAESYLNQVSEPIKPIKTAKAHTAKKVLDQLATLQKELQGTVGELSKSHKSYSDEEHLAHDARTKYEEANRKVQKRSTGLFTSMAQLQQKSAKLNARRETCDQKANIVRNDYILNIAASNAHQKRYFYVELPQLMQELDGEVYDKAREFMTIISMSELECCGLTQECFTKIMADSCMISRDFNLNCFLHENPTYQESIVYPFDAQDGDKITHIVTEQTSLYDLEKDGKNAALLVAQSDRTIREQEQLLEQLKHLPPVDPKKFDHKKSEKKKDKKKEEREDKENDEDLDPETRMDYCRNNIRKAQTNKLKAEAKLELLRDAGISVDDYIAKAQADIESAEREARERAAAAETVSRLNSVRSDKESICEDSTASYTEDCTTDYSNARASVSSQFHPGRSYPLTAVALYNFAASTPDELSMQQGETLEITADGDGEGWVKARNYENKIGFVPENHLDIHGQEPQSASSYDNTSGSHCDDYSSPPGSATRQGYAADETPYSPYVDQDSNTWARVLYDYEAVSSEELTLKEGDIVQITSKQPRGLEDGWWLGVINDRSGMVPSMIMAELSSDELLVYAEVSMASKLERQPSNDMPPVHSAYENLESESTEENPMLPEVSDDSGVATTNGLSNLESPSVVNEPTQVS
ncbi:DgyrCDS8847 [Dimorphilus gyrociliatus]|uniref:DgyrCDS8847 n=1 Tax=Dimorphilus gyrociliatus TaxID=2664684 RepID=A0A7I8VWH8_9ANNE|nr:DgyrCDS8847 [Dimorphilus gyrociliatus]